MNEEAPILDYLSRGGKLTSPENAPPRYRGELMRIMASFVDSEMAGAAGFAEGINDGPGVTERIAAARIVLEKFDHAGRVLSIMGEFGANTKRYETVHPWTARIGRDDDIGAARRQGDMRLNVFWYPLQGWTDAVVMNVLMGAATIIQLTELSSCSYQPLSEVFNEILPREKRHAELGREGVQALAQLGAQERANIKDSFGYWRPRVEATFGGAQSRRAELLRKIGLRHRANEDLLDEWRRETSAFFAESNSV